MDRKKVLELDKICRVCICERKEMRPLFSEKVAEMLMECTNINVAPTEGWPDKICVQCVHSVSRCHSFKMLVERSDKELRSYINSLTVRLLIDESSTDVKSLVSTAAPTSGPKTPTTAPSATPSPMSSTSLVTSNQAIVVHASTQHNQYQQQRQNVQKQQSKLQQQLQQKNLVQQQQQASKSQPKFTQKQTRSQQQLQSPPKKKATNATATTTTAVVVSAPPALATLRKNSSQQPMRFSRKSQQQQGQQHILPHEIAAPSATTQAPVPVALSAVSSAVRASVAVQNALPQQIIQSQQPHTQQQQVQQLMPSTTTANTAAMVLSNGQFLTTQLLPNSNGPQIAQIISAAPASAASTSAPITAALQPQFASQLIQATNGQTFQLIQQPNGQQTLQLVQLVPQRTVSNLTAGGVGGGGTVSENGHLTGLDGNLHTTTTIVDLEDNDDEGILDDDMRNEHEQHLIDDEDDELESGDIDEENEEQICETIVVEDDQVHQGHQLLPSQLSRLNEDSLSQGDAQELEYLEDVTVTTSQHHHSQEQQRGLQQHHQHQQQHNQFNPQQHHHQSFLHENVIVDDYIIEEIPDDEEMLEDEASGHGGVIHGVDAVEFISEDEELSHQQQQANFIEEHELQYTVLDDDGTTLVEGDVHEVFQAACNEFGHAASGLSSSVSLDNSITNDSNELITADNGNVCCSGTNHTTSRRRKNKAAANTRQLAATASTIAAAAAGDDDFEVDSKLISDFIKQQTESFSAGRYTCNLCRQEFKQFKGLQSHMVQHSNWIRANCKKQPQCEICSKSFKGPGMLKMHMKTHQTIAKTPVCNICSKTFKSKAILYRHRQIHQQRFYACAVDNCRKTFSSSTTLRAHADRKHQDLLEMMDKYKCGECGEVFSDIDQLDDHVQFYDHSTGTSLALSTDAGDMSGVSSDGVTGTSIGSHHQSAIGDVFVVTQA